MVRRLGWFLLLLPCALHAKVTTYEVRLDVDLDRRVLHGRETIRFDSRDSLARWRKQAGLTLERSTASNGGTRTPPGGVAITGHEDHERTLAFQYTATPARGFRWLPEAPGFFTAFYCDAWMVCNPSPDHRALLKLEIVVNGAGFRAVGPGTQKRDWMAADGHHWVFETDLPVQTYLWSFAVARLERSASGRFEVFAPGAGHAQALRQTLAAEQFFREKTHVSAVRDGYRQAFLPQPGIFGQEADGLALMTETALANLEDKGDVVLMAHELAHQWWGVRVGIRSWSDFWLNEGMAEYMSLLYLERVAGHEAFAREMDRLRSRFAEMQAKGQDRPLHFEAWKDAADALGSLPYVKGALFLDRLREKVGDVLFWRAIALYTQRNAGKLVESTDFQRAFAEAAQVDLREWFDRDVYGR